MFHITSTSHIINIIITKHFIFYALIVHTLRKLNFTVPTLLSVSQLQNLTTQSDLK